MVHVVEIHLALKKKKTNYEYHQGLTLIEAHSPPSILPTPEGETVSCWKTIGGLHCRHAGGQKKKKEENLLT